MQETQVQFLSLEDPLEKEMATCFSILALEIPWTEEPGGLQSMGSQRVGQSTRVHTHTHTHTHTMDNTQPDLGQESLHYLLPAMPGQLLYFMAAWPLHF